MKAGIMQPYFLPYLGYFSIIKHTDRFILFDTVQFIRHGWIERNRILKPAEGWQYIQVPLEKHHRDTRIQDIKIRNTEDWRDKMLRQIQHYKKAPFYYQALQVLKTALTCNTESITELNAHVLKTVCEYLNIPLQLDIFSKMDISIEHADAGEWALFICKEIGATQYINPTGGKELFDVDKYAAAGVDIQFMGNKLLPYPQRRPVFEPGLSMLDVLMFNDVEQTHRLLDAVYFEETKTV